MYALDADRRGRLLWKKRIGRGGPLGGIEWGGAIDGDYAFYPISDYDFDHPLNGGGFFALDLRTWNTVWLAPPPKPSCLGVDGCSPAQMAPPTAIPGVVFEGSLDGHLRAYDARTGQVIWDFNTAQRFLTANGIQAHGGALNGAGPTIVGGMVFATSGYTNAMSGNVLLCVCAGKFEPPRIAQPASETARR